MRRFVQLVLMIIAAGSVAFSQERGVEFSFMPAVSDTTAGSMLFFEIVARDEDSDIITDWDSSGFPVQIQVHNSTANTDTSTVSWNSDKLGYTYAKLYDAFGGELAATGENSFYVPKERFSGGRLQVAFTHTKAETGVYLRIVPKITSSDNQTSRLYTFTPGPLKNYFAAITSQTADGNQVFLKRDFELVTAGHDRFKNVVAGEVPIAFTARYPAELPALQDGTLPYAVEGYTSIRLQATAVRIRADDTLQRIEVYDPTIAGSKTKTDGFEIIDHSPGGFTLVTPASGTEIQLGHWKNDVRFEWNPAPDPFTNIIISRFDGSTTSDTILYRVYVADFNNLVTRVNFPANSDARATNLTLTHGDLGNVAIQLHGAGATRLNAVWWVIATDGIYTVASTSATLPSESSHTIQANLLTLGSKRVDEAADRYALMQNYPNPFNPSTTIEYTIPERTPVRIQVFDMYGALVSTLVDTYAEPGSYRVVWDGRRDNGTRTPSGSYLLSMTAGQQSQSRVMSLIQ